MNASLRELNVKASELARRAEAGETITITDRGRPIAELGPIARRFRFARREDVLKSFEGLEPVDYAALRADLDAIAEPYWRDPYEQR